MTVTVGIIGPEGPTRRVADHAIGSHPTLFVCAVTSTLADFRDRFKETRPMVVLLGTTRIERRGDGSGAFWRGIEWCHRRFPKASLAVWFETADDGALVDLHACGVLGIVQAEDANETLWPKLVLSIFNGASLWSRPFAIQFNPHGDKGTPPMHVGA